MLQKELNLIDETILGFIGSFYRYEGLELLLETFPLILNHCPNTKLLLVGGGVQKTNLQNKVKELGLEGYVIFSGRIPHSEVQKYYQLVDIFVYPRLPMRLTDLVTPLKPLEAMAQEKLVVASDVGGHKELISNGENGLLFKAGDKVDLSQKILKLISNQNEWQSLKKAGREYVERERNWPNSVNRYVEIFDKIIKDRN